jgi:glycerol kinase
MPRDHLLALDQGTSSSRAIVFTREGRVAAMAQAEFTQHYPEPGWVEHDPLEIWATQLATAREALARAGLAARDIAAIGITNQRETTVLWRRSDGRPVHRAIVWQDRRTAPMCRQLREAGLSEAVRHSTGLLIDPYFSGTKLRWLLDHVPGAHLTAARGELAFGTIDTWLLWNLTQGRVHATDTTNASRTMLYDIRHGAWDPSLLTALHVPEGVLPAVHPSRHGFGECDAQWFGEPIPVCGIAGDQQAALFGQAGFAPGVAKNTYGTGCFLLVHAGASMPEAPPGLLTTAAATPDGTRAYAIEGSVFVGGAVVQWLRDGLHAIDRSASVQALADTVPDTGGVCFVPAFTGLGAPHWDAEARGAILGLTRGSTVAHIARAALESIAFQSAELLREMATSPGHAVHELRVDGGASVNDLLMQFQADLLGVPVLRPEVTETTALGAAWLAGLGAGLYRSAEEVAATWRAARRFEPQQGEAWRAQRMAGWARAVRQVRAG